MSALLTAGLRRWIGLCAAVACASLVLAAPAMAEFGLSRFAIGVSNQDGTSDLQAGSHPHDLTTTFVLKLPSEENQWEGDLRDAELQLPPGLVGDPNATPRCTYQEFASKLEGGSETCKNDTAVGLSTSYLAEIALPGNVSPVSYPVYNLVPPKGVAAEFGFIVAGKAPVLLTTSVRTGTDYGLDSTVSDVDEAVTVGAAKVTIWGVPAEHSHDLWRGSCLRPLAGEPNPVDTSGMGLGDGEDELEGPLHIAGDTPEEDKGVDESKCSAEAEEPPKPLLTNPTSCGAPRTATLSVDDWEEPGNLTGERTRTASLPPLSGCEELEFNPKIAVEPSATSASTPTGLNIDVEVPQEGTESAGGLAEGTVKDTTVTLPAAMRLNASAADGLQACSLAQVGFERFEELPSVPGVQTARFTPAAPSCPPASKLANVRIKSPDLEGELEGGVYLAAPQNFAGLPENPFSSLLALYLVAEEPQTGVLVKLAGEVTPNPETGQLTTSFENTPQLPFSRLELEFFTGERAPLSTPALCGNYATVATFTPWSGTPPVTRSSSFQVSSGPGGSPCTSSQPFAPSLAAGTSDINAGAFSQQLTTVINREDSNQALGAVQVHLPGGLAGIIAGVPECGEAEANAGTCPESSEIGQTTASVGLGNDPYTVTGGRVYLTGPYQGAPFGLSIVTPAVAGPFNLGEVVVRAKIEIDPHTAQVTVSTGEIPHIIRGIPLEIKHVNVTIDRPGFAFNPTSCEPMQITGTLTSDEGASAAVSSPFQAASCQALKFEPKVQVTTNAHTSKANGASLDFKFSYPVGAMGREAWFSKLKVDIPRQLPARLTTLQKACTEAQFAANPAGCPSASNIGHAIVRTEVLPVALEGPVYFVSHGNAKFPEVVIVLQGDGVRIDLNGETNISKAGVTSATFNAIPGVPFETTEVDIPTGPYSEFTANGDICHETRSVLVKKKVTVKVRGKNEKVTRKVKETEPESLVMPTAIVAANGAEIHQNTPIAVTECSKAVKSKAKKTKKKRKSAKRRTKKK